MAKLSKSILVVFLITATSFYSEIYGQAVVADSAEYNAILQELKEIKAIQDSTYQQRLRAAERRMLDAEARRGMSRNYELSEYGVMSNIEANTRPSFFSDDINAIGIIALAVALASLAVACITLKAQKKTEENTRRAEEHTKRAPISVQKGKLKDLPRHFYRNLACTCSQIFLFTRDSNRDSSGRHISYPSESNVMKLQTLPDDIILPIDAANEKVYLSMHELRLLFRNYSQEVAVAAEHLSRTNITDKSLQQDFDNLLFKPLFLTSKTFGFESELDGVDKTLNEKKLRIRARMTMIQEHFDKLKDNIAFLMIVKQFDYLQELMEDNFKKLKDLDKGDALSSKRSAKPFFCDKADGKDVPAKVSRKSFMDELDKSGDKNGGKSQKSEFAKDICAVTDSAGLAALIGKYATSSMGTSDETVNITDLYGVLSQYFEFLKADEWEFETMFFYMLAVDTAIETHKTGMINY